MENKWRKHLRDLMTVLIGCAIGSYAIVAIMIPNGLTYGGIAGLSRLLQSQTGADYSLMYYLLAAAIVLIVWIALGFGEVRKIIAMSVAYPTMMMVFERLDLVLLESKDLFLSAIFLGVAFGVSNGIVFYGGFSSGGTDSLAKVIRHRLTPHLSMSRLLFMIDIVIIAVQAFFFGRNIALYALVSMFVSMRLTDMVVYGISSKIVKLSTITTASDELSAYVMNEIGRGVTSCTVVGEYTGQARKELVIYCSPRESMLIKRFLGTVDPNAFVSVMKVSSVWGEGRGFSDLHSMDEK